MELKDRVFTITPVILATEVDTNEILAATQVLAILPPHSVAYPYALFATDENDAARAMEIWILRSNSSVGAAGAAENHVVGAKEELLARIPIAATDWTATANYFVCEKKLSDTGIGLGWMGVTDNTVYIAIKYLDATADTYALGDLSFKFTLGVVDTNYAQS